MRAFSATFSRDLLRDVLLEPFAATNQVDTHRASGNRVRAIVVCGVARVMLPSVFRTGHQRPPRPPRLIDNVPLM